MSVYDSNKSIIMHFCEKYNISLEESVISDFDTMTEELLEFNSHTNLTAVREPREVAIKHHADSLALLMTEYLKGGMRVIDVGCGAGFPGLPLATARRDIDISFLDSTAKKLKFTALCAEKLGIRANILPLRAEDAAKDKKLREGFDVAVSRAMANLPVLCELCLPFVRVGGVFAAYKGAQASDTHNPESELSRSLSGISKLGGEVEKIINYDLCDFYRDDDEDKKHCLIIIRKKKPTPPSYPRRYPQIISKPL